MSDAQVADVPAPEATGTAPVAEAPVSGGEKPEAPETRKPERTFTQAELDALVGERLAKERRKQERERDRAVAEAVARTIQQSPKPEPKQSSERPKPESYETTDAYLEALTDWKAAQAVDARLEAREKAMREAAGRHEAEETSARFNERCARFASQHPDFQDVAMNPQLSLTTHSLHVLQELERGEEVLYQLGKNPQEAARIAKLSPYLQAIELGRLADKLPAPKPAPKTSSAPEPIIPVSGGKTAQPVFDTTDPRSTKTMTPSQWIEAENARLKAKIEKEWRAQGRIR